MTLEADLVSVVLTSLREEPDKWSLGYGGVVNRARDMRVYVGEPRVITYLVGASPYVGSPEYELKPGLFQGLVLSHAAIALVKKLKLANRGAAAEKLLNSRGATPA